LRRHPQKGHQVVEREDTDNAATEVGREFPEGATAIVAQGRRIARFCGLVLRDGRSFTGCPGALFRLSQNR
jgi:hypothetical protein